MTPCPICKSPANTYLEDKKRRYLKCSNCELIFVPEDDHLSDTEEKERYDTHNNDVDNEGYVAQFERLIEEVANDFREGNRGLDFGSGPSPVLAELLRDDGYDMSIYDLFYEDNRAVFNESYDFISATEVIEHLADPVKEMQQLFDCLEPGGRLYILTQRYPSKDEFLNWYYKNDHTHISFFASKTFEELAAILGAEMEIIDKTLVILTK